jgi:hypothetical protein
MPINVGLIVIEMVFAILDTKQKTEYGETKMENRLINFLGLFNRGNDAMFKYKPVSTNIRNNTDVIQLFILVKLMS